MRIKTIVALCTVVARVGLAQGGDTTIVQGTDETRGHVSRIDTMSINRSTPKLACIDVPNSKVNFASLKTRARCAGCSDKVDEILGWGKSSTSATSVSAQLPPKPSATVTLKCEQTSADIYRLSAVGAHQSLAGWGGYPGNYRFAESWLYASGTTAIRVPRWNWQHQCLRVLQRDGRSVATKAYPGSYLFKEGTTSLDGIVVADPNGKQYAALKPGTVVRLKPAGLWTIHVNLQEGYESSWAEDSGKFDDLEQISFRIGRC
jgi:hypothetical protein